MVSVPTEDLSKPALPVIFPNPMPKYDPGKHHRRSIRLKGYDYTKAGSYFVTICSWQREYLFGSISGGQVQLSRYGEIVQFNWDNLPKRYPNVELDAFVVMPNHVHGIVVLLDQSRGAGLGNQSVQRQKSSVKPAPTGLGEIVRGFKTFSARRINQVRDGAGVPVWQRNYYEHVIRNEESLQKIREYVINNPLTWLEDQLHSENPSKW